MTLIVFQRLYNFDRMFLICFLPLSEIKNMVFLYLYKHTYIELVHTLSRALLKLGTFWGVIILEILGFRLYAIIVLFSPLLYYGVSFGAYFVF